MPTPISGRVSKPTAKSGASKTKAKAKAKPQPQTAEEHREWENQYLQGKPSEYSAGYDREIEQNDSPYLDFLSPFEGQGRFESTTEKDEPGWDFLRFSNGPKADPKYHLFVVPHQHIEQIIIIPDKEKNKNNFHIVVVPTAATGSSAAVRQYPKIIRLKVPKSSVQQARLLRDAQGQPSFKNHIQSPETQEVVFQQNTRDQNQPVMFKCLANLEGENDTYLESSEGK
ncbi:hypothetical protein NW762_001036 [Fusarium torreyae]|uniref:Uncharacterized protein n=1 Tax=Fusarium torreyae TaxID=1237075 RepID=A0A9W8SIK8_9HYPO|nr:hypothetical protein NW762_001036 [Fusarium torreyae]